MPVDMSPALTNLKSCSQLAKRVPNSRGNKTAPSTIWRWMESGRLRFVVVGGRWMSTEEWLFEMFEREAQAARSERGIGEPTAIRTKVAGDRAAAAAAAKRGYVIRGEV